MSAWADQRLMCGLKAALISATAPTSSAISHLSMHKERRRPTEAADNEAWEGGQAATRLSTGMPRFLCSLRIIGSVSSRLPFSTSYTRFG